MDFLQSLLDSSSVPAITAFILGILTAVSPCPLATNITAIGFYKQGYRKPSPDFYKRVALHFRQNSDLYGSWLYSYSYSS